MQMCDMVTTCDDGKEKEKQKATSLLLSSDETAFAESLADTG